MKLVVCILPEIKKNYVFSFTVCIYLTKFRVWDQMLICRSVNPLCLINTLL